MTAIYRAHLTVPGVPAAVLGKAKDSVAVAAHIGGPVAAKADTAFIDGVHIALYTAAGAGRPGRGRRLPAAVPPHPQATYSGHQPRDR